MDDCYNQKKRENKDLLVCLGEAMQRLGGEVRLGEALLRLGESDSRKFWPRVFLGEGVLA